MIAVHRGSTQQPFSPDLVAALDDHARDLRRMLAVRGKLAAARRRTSSLQGMLDRMPQGTMLVRADGTLLHLNAAAERLLRKGEVLRVAGGKLDAPAATRRSLAEALASACSDARPLARSFMLQDGSGRRWVANAAPFTSPGGSRCALVIVHDLGGDMGGAGPLQELFGLSGAEAAVAAELAKGRTPREIAGSRGVSIDTVRSQLKAIADKFGCHRQAEIVAIVKSATSSLAAPASSLERAGGQCGTSS